MKIPRIKYKTKDRIHAIIGIIFTMMCYVLITVVIGVTSTDIYNTWHDTRIICLQVTHHSKECR